MNTEIVCAERHRRSDTTNIVETLDPLADHERKLVGTQRNGKKEMHGNLNVSRGLPVWPNWPGIGNRDRLMVEGNRVRLRNAPTKSDQQLKPRLRYRPTNFKRTRHNDRAESVHGFASFTSTTDALAAPFLIVSTAFSHSDLSLYEDAELATTWPFDALARQRFAFA